MSTSRGYQTEQWTASHLASKADVGLAEYYNYILQAHVVVGKFVTGVNIEGITGTSSIHPL